MFRNPCISRKLMVIVIIVHYDVPSWNATSPLQTPLLSLSPPPLMVLGVSLFLWGQDVTTRLWRLCGQRDVTLLGDYATALHLRGNTIFSLDASLPHHVTQFTPLQPAMAQSALLSSVPLQPVYQCISHCWSPVPIVGVSLGLYWPPSSL